MRDYGGLLAEVGQQMQRRVRDMELMSARWHDGLDAALADLDRQLTDLDDRRNDDVPADAPRQFRDVARKFDVGELDWLTVAQGDTEDEDARVVSVWMDRRLQAAQAEFRVVENPAARP
jgi:hypothetical protein